MESSTSKPIDTRQQVILRVWENMCACVRTEMQIRVYILAQSPGSELMTKSQSTKINITTNLWARI